MKHILFLFALFFVSAALTNTLAAAENTNFVVVLIDDMGYSDLPSFGGKDVQTPNIDLLAKEGQHFTSFYTAAPICSPSRCGIITGQYPQRWNITSYLDNRKRNEERGVAQWLDVKAPSFPRLLQKAGYAAGHFGKWHLGGQRDVGDAPLIQEYGFAQSLTNFEGLGDRVLPILQFNSKREPKKHALGSDNLERGNISWADRHKITGIYTEAALNFIKQAEKDNKPFYVNLWLDDVHSPFHPANGKHTGTPENKRERYVQVLNEMDRQLAPLFDYIRTNETLYKNTLLILFSDNGPEPGAGHSEPFRGFKGELYEGGIRSPLIVWGGPVNKNVIGTVNGKTVLSAIDIAPSFLHTAGIDIPEEYKFDGENFSEVFLGNQTEQERKRPLIWQRPPDRPGQENNPLPDFALRSGQWKFLMSADGSKMQLYNIVKDTSESNNLSDNEPQLAAKFKQQIIDWSKSVETKY